MEAGSVMLLKQIFLMEIKTNILI